MIFIDLQRQTALNFELRLEVHYRAHGERRLADHCRRSAQEFLDQGHCREWTHRDLRHREWAYVDFELVPGKPFDPPRREWVRVIGVDPQALTVQRRKSPDATIPYHRVNATSPVLPPNAAAS